MIITFIGHSSLTDRDAVYSQVKNVMNENITKEDKVLFYCVGYGEFDRLCAEVCREFKKTHSACELIYISPYFTMSYQEKMKYMTDMGLYDSTVYPPLENTHPKIAIIKRNEWMVNESDLIIAYVRHTYGGAYKTYSYALRKNKRIINIFEYSKK